MPEARQPTPPAATALRAVLLELTRALRRHVEHQRELAGDGMPLEPAELAQSTAAAVPVRAAAARPAAAAAHGGGAAAKAAAVARAVSGGAPPAGEAGAAAKAAAAARAVSGAAAAAGAAATAAASPTAAAARAVVTAAASPGAATAATAGAVTNAAAAANPAAGAAREAGAAAEARSVAAAAPTAVPGAGEAPVAQVVGAAQEDRIASVAESAAAVVAEALRAESRAAGLDPELLPPRRPGATPPARAAAPAEDDTPKTSTLRAFSMLAEESQPAAIAMIPPERRPASLDVVRERLGACTRCKLHKTRRSIVFGAGSPGARLMLISDAPGEPDEGGGEPLLGEAGGLLDKIIAAMGLARGQVYLATIVKCRPPGDRDPEPEEIARCEPFLTDQIVFVQPEVIVTLGKVASEALLKVRTPITRLRGNWREYRGVPVMPTLHPAYLLRAPAAKRLVWQDVQQVMQRLGLGAQ